MYALLIHLVHINVPNFMIQGVNNTDGNMERSKIAYQKDKQKHHLDDHRKTWDKRGLMSEYFNTGSNTVSNESSEEGTAKLGFSDSS